MTKKSPKRGNGRGRRRGDDEEIGYGKPPKSHQFQPGQSGNPKGRPKGSRSLEALASDLLSEKISSTLRGKHVRMTAKEALLRVIRELAFKGNLKATALLLAFEQGSGAVPEPEEKLSAEDREIVAAFLKSVKNETKQ